MKAYVRFLLPWFPGGVRWVHTTAAASVLAAGFAVHPLVPAPTSAPPPWQGNVHLLPPVPAKVKKAPLVLGAGSGAWYVHNVVVRYGYSGPAQDISAIINAAGDRYGVSPIFLAATIGTESGFDVYAERWAGGLDNSCGLMQQIITNVAAFTGIQDGRAACNWEENPVNSIDFGARILRDDMAYHGYRIGPPNAYIMYNAGAGYGDTYYWSPPYGSQAWLNYYDNFMPNWNYAWAHFAVYGPPAPVKKTHPFPVARWNQYRVIHHQAIIPYRVGGRFTWAASVWRLHAGRLQGILRREHWYAPTRGRRHGYTITSFQGGAVYTWPGLHASKVVRTRFVR